MTSDHPTFRLIRTAINQKHLIRFWYEEDDKRFAGYRTVEPHIIAQTNFKSGIVALKCWYLPRIEDIAGKPESMLLSGIKGEKWDLLYLERMRDIDILTEMFEVREDLNITDARFQKILHSIE